MGLLVGVVGLVLGAVEETFEGVDLGRGTLGGVPAWWNGCRLAWREVWFLWRGPLEGPWAELAPRKVGRPESA